MYGLQPTKGKKLYSSIIGGVIKYKGIKLLYY